MNLKNYLTKAQKEHWAIGQFNFSTIEQLRGILSAAKETKSPIILGTSEGESSYLGLEETIALFEISKKKYNVNAFLNFDHGRNLDLVKKAVDFGYNCVHFDGSSLSFENNISETKRIVDYAHKKGVLVEGELGKIEGESKLHREEVKVKQENLTSPDDVFKFVKETKVDSLAVSIGNIHGIYRKEPGIDFERLKDVSKKSKAYLVLHGGSGIMPKDIRKAISLGIVKININTELRIAWKESLIKSLKALDKEARPYKILSQSEDSVRKITKEKIKLFTNPNL
ncbi:MAG: class II fructose-bisphosphate aldolase [Candidatus Pacebacteria bacterium]|nr:class II fructose-bisphosphate aldolase [Candidatus Paceibacterota bacterium]